MHIPTASVPCMNGIHFGVQSFTQPYFALTHSNSSHPALNCVEESLTSKISGYHKINGKQQMSSSGAYVLEVAPLNLFPQVHSLHPETLRCSPDGQSA